MKKIILLITIFVLISSMISCNNVLDDSQEIPGYNEVTTENQDQTSTSGSETKVDHYSESVIKANFSEYINKSLYNGENKTTADDIQIINNYGKIGAYTLYQLGSSKVDLKKDARDEKVGSFTLSYKNEEPTYLYNYGVFYTIKEAYDKKLITSDIIIGYGQKICSGILMDLSNYEKEKNIDQKLATEIKISYSVFVAVEASKVNISIYYGEVEGCHIVTMGGDGILFTMAHRVENVAEYLLQFSSGKLVYVYKDNNFYTIEEAYEEKILSKSGVYEFGKKVCVDFLEMNPVQK